MNSKSSPLVSVVTPVYNNEEDLAECIESVLAQTYQNWDYTIINNCSTDRSGEIARRYAAQDPRIKVIDNQQFLRVIPNHNHALRQISPESTYCKVVFADDLIFQRCLERMICVGEEHPSAGIVGAYRLENDRVCGGVPYPSRLISGREICRQTFFEHISVFGTANSVLYRSELVRNRNPFYNESNLHADQEVCVALLKNFDFGFVHEVLTYTRPRATSLNKMAVDMQIELGCHLSILVSHGPDFLREDELNQLLGRHLATYYNFLAVSLLWGHRDKKFWELHRQKLNEAVGFSRGRLARAALARLCKAVLNPYETIGKVRSRRRPAALAPNQKAQSTPPLLEKWNADH